MWRGGLRCLRAGVRGLGTGGCFLYICGMILLLIEKLLFIAGSLCLFLYGMKVLSDGIQQSAGARLQGVLKFMTGHRLSAVLTGCGVTAIIQSSSATTVMVVAFVNAGLLTLEQAVGVIMGANIGTTITAWLVSLIGFSFSIASIALPAIGIGFILSAVRWNRREIGNVIMGLGILFLGLDFLTKSMPALDAQDLDFIRDFRGTGLLSVVKGLVIGLVITLILHSSSASTAIVITMAHNGMIGMEFGAAMVLGANIGTTIDAFIASIGTKTAGKRAALVHILFNVIGSVWAVVLLSPLLELVNILLPAGSGATVTFRIALFHTIFNLINTILFLPFVRQFTALVTFLVKDREDEKEKDKYKTYKFPYLAASMRQTPELNIVRAEKEIRDLAALVFKMYSSLRKTLATLSTFSEETIKPMIEDLQMKEEYADQMREELTGFLLKCARQQLNARSEYNIALLFRIIADLEDMTDSCYSISLLLERSVRKHRVFKQTELDALNPYMGIVEEFLAFVHDHLGGKLAGSQTKYARQIEEDIDLSRNKLRKLGQKRIEEGEDVSTELLFIDLVRRIERIGDYCNGISSALSAMQ